MAKNIHFRRTIFYLLYWGIKGQNVPRLLILSFHQCSPWYIADKSHWMHLGYQILNCFLRVPFYLVGYGIVPNILTVQTPPRSPWWVSDVWSFGLHQSHGKGSLIQASAHWFKPMYFMQMNGASKPGFKTTITNILWFSWFPRNLSWIK